MAANTVPIFNGWNYDIWCVKMRAYLKSEGMWDLVEKGYDDSKTEEAKEMQKKKDGEALLKILNAIPESIVPSLKNAETSKEAWIILHQKYCGDEEENVLGMLSRQSSGNQNVSGDIRDNTNAGEEVEASTPTPSSPITSTGSEFEVFLSFRGVDTRKGFTGHLYEGLQQRGVSTFKDDVNLDKGKEIDRLLEYIEKSKIFVPIFSQHYADSKWCLKEVTKSIECGKEIVPIFFGVEPSDVQNQKGSFEDAFNKHESNKRQNQEEVKKWKEALKIVGNLSGFTLKEKNGDEVELKHAIIKRVLNIVNKKPLPVAKHPIGVETRVEDVKRMLKNIEREGVGVIGIHGMGGLGKTTIAKAVYNELAEGFNGATCFLSDVRKNAEQPNGLVALQKQVFHQIFKDENINLLDVAHGASLIKERANEKRVLLILDDVDSVKQMDALAGKRDWFGSGSVIIITNRDKKVLVAHNVKEHEIYEPTILNEEQSRKLFLQHAFSGKEPKGDYLQLSNEVIAAAAGLPLTLEVLGSLLTCDMQVQEWKYTLKKLKKIPHKEVLQRLKLSYDRLDIYQQKIFLDISYFFIGWGRQNATYMWEGCNWFPDHSIKVLLQRSLIKIDEESGEFWMHDQIRDMGRAIVMEESSGKAEKQSRLWDPKDCLNLLQWKGTKDVEAIYLYSHAEFGVDTNCFAAMSQLRLLLMRGMTLKGDYKHFPKELQYLQCSLTKLDSLPTSLHLENIVVLDLSWSSIIQFWDAPKVNINMCLSLWSGKSKSSEMPVLEKMRVLKLKGCYRLRMCPDFRSMPHLQILDCEGCSNMSELHPSIGHLQSLINLNLKDCRSLKRLPKCVWQLTSLKELNLKGCTKITTLSSPIGDCQLSKPSMLEKIKILNLEDCSSLITCPNFKSMPHLKKLRFNKCDELKELDPSFSHLKSLMMECNALKELPQEIGQLTSLEELVIFHCSQISTLPESMGYLKQLKSLNLRFCSSLQYLPPLPPSLISFEVQYCEKLENIADVSNAKGLQGLSLYSCERLVDIPGIEQLKCLETLSLQGCRRLCSSIPERIKGLDGLTTLHLFGCLCSDD